MIPVTDLERVAQSKTDDEPPFSSLKTENQKPPVEKENQNLIGECLRAFVEAAGIATPSGKLPIAEISTTLESIDGTVGDLVEFLKAYAGRWHDAPATWKHVLTSVQRWAADPKTLAEIHAREDLRICEERRAAEGAAEQRLLSTPTDPDAAMECAVARGVNIPRVLRAQLTRIGGHVTPAEVAERARTWRKCKQCADEGLVGEVLAKTLRFCECLAGEERQREDAEFPAREIARVHVNLQSRMAAAAHPCVADAIQACEIEDDGQTLRVVVPKFYKIFINEREIEAILLKLGETRALDVIGGYTPKPGATAQQPVKVPPVVVPIQKSGAPRSVLDRAPCARCGGELVIYSDGTGSDCACRRPGLQQTVTPIELLRKVAAR